MTFTILGGNGFIGRHLSAYLTAQGHDVHVPPRDISDLYGENLGHIVYAIGLTGDFRTRPHDTIEAHVTLLSDVLKKTTYNSFLYLSSTRVYGGLSSDQTSSEEAKLPVTPNSDSLYDLSKLLGEALCLSMKNPSVCVARLSNVYGADMSRATFLGAVLQEIRETGKVSILDNPASSKDYIAIEDVCFLLREIVLHGRHSLYNVASGASVTCAEIAEWLQEAGKEVTFANENPPRVFPAIETARIRQDFAFTPRLLKDDIKQLLG